MGRGFLDDDETRKSDLVDVDMILHAETPKALLVSDDGDKANAVWIPKSQTDFTHKSRNNSSVIVALTMPEWLAKEKGLI